MRNAINRFGLCFVLVAAGACSSSSSTEPGGSGGSSGGGSGGGSGSGSGGSSGSGSGGAMTTGSGGSSGSGSGGSTTSGSSGSTTTGSGGSTTTGDGGSVAPTDGGSNPDAKAMEAGVGGGDAAGGSHTPVPSAGCGKPNPNMPKRTITTGGMMASYNVNVPANYDNNKPMPLGFGFHGYNNPACGPTGGECQGFAQLPAITVYTKSITAGWEGQPQPLAENLQYYQDVKAAMLNEYCIDTSRIFIAGVSSGGQFIEHIACIEGDKLWQVTAVSAYIDGASVTTNCKGTPPVLVTQGATEDTTMVNVKTPTMFAMRNGCSATPPAAYMQNLADMKAAFMMGKADVRCMDWDGCTLNPVRYCISSQMTYGGLTHGWPKVGGMLISDFQNTLPK